MDVSVSRQSTDIPGEVMFEQVFVSDPGEKPKALSDLMSFMSTRRTLDDQEEFRFRLCLDEAVENALKHGNRYDPSKKIAVSYFETDDGWGVTVRDEGEGFDPRDVPDPQTDEALFRESGRGLFIMTRFMDSLEYYDGGRTALLFKKSR